MTCKHLWSLVLTLITLTPGIAHAELLGDTGVQNLYAEASAAASDPTRMTTFMQQRWDDSFMLKVNVAITAGDQSQNFTQNLNKADAIRDAMKTAANSKLETYQNHIDRIQYSPDGKSAFVNNRINYVRLASAQGANGQTVPVHYETQQACNDVVALASDATLKIVHSECNAAITVHP